MLPCCDSFGVLEAEEMILRQNKTQCDHFPEVKPRLAQETPL